MADTVVDRFLAYLDASPSPLHAVEATLAALRPHGFVEVDLGADPTPMAPGFRGFVRRAGTIFAFVVGRGPVAESGFRIVSAHTDSPNLRIKPQPYVKGHGYVRLGVEVYGGVTVPTWSDRDLGIAGSITVRNGAGTRQVLVNLNRPLCRIPNVAIHLNRTVNDEGLKLNKQTHLPAVLMLESDDEDPLRTLLTAETGVVATDILTWDLSLYDLTPAAVAGANDDFVFSARLDNLGCCHSGLEGLLGALDSDLPLHTSILALFDHEEIGSHTNRGANSRTIETVLGRIVDSATDGGAGGLTRALTRSSLISADMAHAVHPAYADRHDAQHMPKINAGPVLKQNANYRYTTEGESAAMFVLLCERAEVPFQWFVNRSDLRCGSTVGPMLASRLGIQAVDVGNPMLSMHSAREMCGAKDHGQLARVFSAYFEG